MNSDGIVGLLREYIQLALREGTIGLKKPKTPQEAAAFINLLSWAGKKMQVPGDELQTAIEKSKKGNWSDALDLMSMYYVMKGIKFKRPD